MISPRGIHPSIKKKKLREKRINFTDPYYYFFFFQNFKGINLFYKGRDYNFPKFAEIDIFIGQKEASIKGKIIWIYF